MESWFGVFSILTLVIIIIIIIIIMNLQPSCLHIQRLGFDSRRYQIFWEVVCLERGPLSLVSTTEELIDRKVAAPV
jgi:hypothetical protein